MMCPASEQRTPPPTAAPVEAEPEAVYPKVNTHGRYLPGQLGRFPTVGLDQGAIKGTVPGANLH
jgi:hypothetical protein